jgi:leader peptidase (prepilin peptidase)/N-methyltransferase
LVAITFIDLEHRIIPDELSWGGMALGLLTSYWDLGMGGFWVSAAGAFLGFGVFYFFAWAYWKLTGRHGLGGGDIKLLGMLGAFLGPYGVFTTILLSSVLGSLFGIVWALATRKGDLMKSSLPFGPFLVVGGLYYYLLGEVLWLPFTIPT